MLKPVIALFAVSCALLASTTMAQAQKATTFVVPFAPGGPTDQITRLVASELNRRTGKTYLIENKPGAGGIVAAQYVLHGPADGSAYFVGSNGSLVLNKGLFRTLPYNPDRDFVPVSGLTRSPLVLVVNNDLPAKNLKELIELSKTKPGGLNMGSSGEGTIPHIFGSRLIQAAGINAVHVPFPGAAPAMQSLLGGHIDFMLDTLSTTLEYVKSGRVRALGIAATTRFTGLPQVATLKEQGFDMRADSWFGLVAAAKTPPDVVDQMNRDLNAVLRDEQFKAKLASIGIEPLPGTAKDFSTFVATENAEWLPEIKRLNITVN